MSRSIRLLLLWLIVLFSSVLSLSRVVQAQALEQNQEQKQALQADVTLQLADNQSLWMGQQITVNMTLRTNGQLFSNILFNLPEVKGAFFLQTDTSTLKSSETSDGESWQTITYPLTLFAQKSGPLQIPPITVRFESSQGFGTQAQHFELKTDGLPLNIKAPPGISGNDMVISTSGFQLDYQWQPENGVASVGAAFTLSVTRNAENIAAMLFPPLPVYQTPGLASYPQAPEINDRSNRGSLTGTRKDHITWVAETPGDYAIPEIRMQWFDPASGQLEQQIIPGLQLTISAAGVSSDNTEASHKGDQRLAFAALLLLLILGTLLWWPAPRQRLQTWLAQRKQSESGAYKTLIKHCQANQPAESYQAYQSWIGHYDRASEIVNLAEMIPLTRELNRLQEAIVINKPWQGQALRKQLKILRQRLRKHTSNSRPALPDLNP